MPPIPESRLIVRDRIGVEVIGTGPDVIFVPGLSSSRATWLMTAKRLMSKYRLHLVQVAGFAGEPARANATGEVLMPTAEDIAAYIREQQLAPATLIGHSMGGTLSLYLAQKYPDDIAKIMIIDALPFLGVIYGGPDATPESITTMTDAWRSGTSAWKSEQNDQMVANMVTAPRDVEMIRGWQRTSDPAVVMRALFEDMMLDLRPGLPSVKAAIRVLHPDFEGPDMTGEAVAALYNTAYAPAPNKTIVTVADSRHFIMFDQPQRFAAELDRFLQT